MLHQLILLCPCNLYKTAATIENVKYNINVPNSNTWSEDLNIYVGTRVKFNSIAWLAVK